MTSINDFTAWSHGQVTAKLWLAEILEELFAGSLPRRVGFLGGWYGVGSFILFARDRFPIDSIRSFDIDASCEEIADSINTKWVFDHWKFKAITKDANQIDWSTENWVPHIVVNTSTEHFESDEWFENLNSTMCVAIQCNNQENIDHKAKVESLQEMKSRYPLKTTIYECEKYFSYPDKQYSRFMIIGYK